MKQVATTSELNRSKAVYYYKSDYSASGVPSPWKASFPQSPPLGYWEIFSRRCEKISPNDEGLVSEEAARKIWISILRDYEEYLRMGMWIPEEILGEHRKVAIALGWHS